MTRACIGIGRIGAAGFALAASLAAFLVAMPASAQLFKDDEIYRRVQQIEAQRPGDARRVEGIESRAESQARILVDLTAQIEALKQEIARLRGQIEVLTNEVENGAKRQRDFYVDLDNRVRKLETPPPPPPAPVSAGPKPPTPDEQKAYEAGLNLIKAANYKGAIEAFGAFQKAHPASMLGASAQYWIGNSHFALRDYKAAIAAQQQVVDTWPDDPKSADALLNISSAQIEIKDTRAARATMETVIRRYPQSEAAALAKQRMSKLR